MHAHLGRRTCGKRALVYGPLVLDGPRVTQVDVRWVIGREGGFVALDANAAPTVSNGS